MERRSLVRASPADSRVTSQGSGFSRSLLAMGLAQRDHSGGKLGRGCYHLLRPTWWLEKVVHPYEEAGVSLGHQRSTLNERQGTSGQLPLGDLRPTLSRLAEFLRPAGIHAKAPGSFALLHHL